LVNLALTLPYPPSINAYWRANGHRRFISAEGRKFKQDVVQYVIEKNIPKLGNAALKVTIILQPRDRRKTDIDNRIKAVLDSLQDAGVYDDDCQVEYLSVHRAEAVKGGCCLVYIEAHQPEGELSPVLNR
jgi:crossover junction endodeoxyribonuclease RusA